MHIIQMASAGLSLILVLSQSPQTDIGGSGGESLSFIHTRRGAEKLLFILTIIVGVIFALSSLAVIVLTR